MARPGRLARHLLISGHVQGVGYRWSFNAQANALGVSGWVRNRSDGRVEALICGAPDRVETLTEWAKRGPASARVESVTIYDNVVIEEDGSIAGFEQRPTC